MLILRFVNNLKWTRKGSKISEFKETSLQLLKDRRKRSRFVYFCCYFGGKYKSGFELQRKGSEGNSSVGSDDAASVDSKGDPIIERKGRDEEFEELLEKYNVDEIEEKPKHFYSPFCSRWISLTGVSSVIFPGWGQFSICFDKQTILSWNFEMDTKRNFKAQMDC